ncbi:MAG TPA: tetraacyldisaccharide 4'-kinase [Candidatus Udaeobacter sp.]|jgi:tetraacyldisaccharide 4'-kinase|nr:tetraacyldisaccharide 4'-kinase [Candidatus Udaeobacter sp.]
MRDALSRLAETAWETRRRLYASGVLAPKRVPARVVSVGNLTVGGTGKTTLTLHLARRARERGIDAHVVCRRYRPGPAGEGDEERLYRAAMGGAAVHAGRVKRALAAEAAGAGASLVLIDDGFSHWGLERDLDVVLIDSTDPWGGGRMLPAGRLREPRRALQRAGVVVVSRLASSDAGGEVVSAVARSAPGAWIAAGRHALQGFRGLDGAASSRPDRVWIVTGTGNPDSVSRTATEAGCEVVGATVFRDHHWFRPREIDAVRARADRERATLLTTAKDAVRWPARADGTRVMEVAWQWVRGGEEAERRMLEPSP